MIVSGVAGLSVAINSSEYTLWAVPNIDSSKTSKIIPEDKIAIIETHNHKATIFKDVTL